MMTAGLLAAGSEDVMCKRTVLALLVAIVVALGLVGCGSSGASSSQASQSASGSSAEASQQSQASSSAVAVSQNPDEEFLPALAAGLEARWTLTAQTEGQEDTSQLRAQYVNAELENLAAFEGASFKDPELGQLAERYIAAVEESLACLDSYDTNFLDYGKRWSDAYKERAIVVKELVERYGFKMSDEYQKSLDEMVEEGKKSEQELQVPSDIKQAADEDIPAAAVSAFQKVDGNIYRATVVNPSRASFDYYNLDVYLLNAKGGFSEMHRIEVDNWAPGAEAVFEFTPDSEFASMGALSGDWWATWQN